MPVNEKWLKTEKRRRDLRAKFKDMRPSSSSLATIPDSPYLTKELLKDTKP